MGDPKGFLKINRKETGYRPIQERKNDYNEVEKKLTEAERKDQASRCMDCGVPFCHWACPLGNNIPEWQDKIFKGDWKEAYLFLQETNSFPEITGRVCPALCEESCVLSLENEPVTIRQNELDIIEKAFSLGLVQPCPPKKRTKKKIAIIGGGPAGLTCADFLNQQGHLVTVFEESDALGGYLRYGIPDFKLNKDVIDRRLDLLLKEGILFKTKKRVGKDILVSEIKKEFDVLCLTIGSRQPRDLKVTGRDLKGIYFAMEYLEQQNRMVRKEKISKESLINAFGKNVVVIGGGDTGSDCVGSANRQGAKKVTQLELLPKPSLERAEETPWPLWPKKLKTSSSHQEGCLRKWSVATKEFKGQKGEVQKLVVQEVDWKDSKMTEKKGKKIEIKADLVFLALGFTSVVKDRLTSDLKIKFNERGNIRVDKDYMTSVKGVFAAGDATRGASLVVWAIKEGRDMGQAVNRYLNEL